MRSSLAVLALLALSLAGAPGATAADFDAAARDHLYENFLHLSQLVTVVEPQNADHIETDFAVDRKLVALWFDPKTTFDFEQVCRLSELAERLARFLTPAKSLYPYPSWKSDCDRFARHFENVVLMRYRSGIATRRHAVQVESTTFGKVYLKDFQIFDAPTEIRRLVPKGKDLKVLNLTKGKDEETGAYQDRLLQATITTLLDVAEAKKGFLEKCGTKSGFVVVDVERARLVTQAYYYAASLRETLEHARRVLQENWEGGRGFKARFTPPAGLRIGPIPVPTIWPFWRPDAVARALKKEVKRLRKIVAWATEHGIRKGNKGLFASDLPEAEQERQAILAADFLPPDFWDPKAKPAAAAPAAAAPAQEEDPFSDLAVSGAGEPTM